MFKKEEKKVQKSTLAKNNSAPGTKGNGQKKLRKPSKVSSGSISMYLAEIGKFNPLPPQRGVELAIRIQANDERAMKELVEANLRFVVSVAKSRFGGLSPASLAWLAREPQTRIMGRFYITRF